MATLLEDTFDAQNFTNDSLDSITNSGGETTCVGGGGNQGYVAYRALGTASPTWELYVECKYTILDEDIFIGMAQSGSSDGIAVRFSDWWPGVYAGGYSDIWWNRSYWGDDGGYISANTDTANVIHLRVRYDGTKTSYRYWIGSDPEPGTWNREYTDGSITGNFDRVYIGTWGGGTIIYQYLKVTDLSAAQSQSPRTMQQARLRRAS